MKKSEIQVGGLYVAKVANKLTTVRVDAIREIEQRRTPGDTAFGGRSRTYPASTVYDVTNMTSGRKTTFRSAAKFRRKATAPATTNVVAATGQVLAGAKGVTVIEEIPDGTPVKSTLGDLVMQDDYTVDEDGNEVTEDDGEQITPIKAAALLAKPGEGIEEALERIEVEQRSDPTPSTQSTTKESDSTATSAALPSTAKAGAPVAKTSIPASGGLLSRQLTAERIATAQQPPHVIVEARAGTGKTFTLVVGIVNAFRHRCAGLWDKLVQRLGFDPVPSPQQQLVWDAMAASSGVRTVQFTAFNKSIVREFEEKWGWVIRELSAAGITLQFATNHSMGFAAVRSSFKRLQVSEYTVMDRIADELNQDIKQLRREKFEMLRATEKLVGLCKMNLTDYEDAEAVDALISHYEIELNGSRNQVMDLVPRIMRRCLDPQRDGRIDFDDMIWLPVALGLSVSKQDLLLVDECQDLNKCQQALAVKAGRRIILVGDRAQAIYGFAGADSQSIPRMTQILKDTVKIECSHCGCLPNSGSLDGCTHPSGKHQPKQFGPGCVTLPLTVTRRCGRAIVAEANKIVADFAAHESNPEGFIADAAYPTKGEGSTTKEVPWEQSYLSQVKPGDMVLCRVNAPLVSNCFRFIKRGIRANIQGRDIGAGLISTIKKLDASSVADLISKIGTWLHNETSKEQAKRNPSESRIIALQDRHDCIVCFTEAASTVDAVLRKIEDIFTDDRKGPGIRLSSIHKAKGLEADNVFLLQPKGATIPHPMAKSAWQREQEMNLKYVAITRAIHKLTYVS